MKTDTINTEWYNGTRANAQENFKWPPLKGSFKFHYSAGQHELTLSHTQNLRLGITFSEELQKRFDIHEELVQALQHAIDKFEEMGMANNTDTMLYKELIKKANN